MLVRPPRQATAERLALAGLLALTCALYLWHLDSNRYGNPLQSAAVLAGSGDWTAFLFGSMDGGNAITHDKPAAGCWIMILFVKIFGFSPWSLLIPQALMGVATVATLYLSVRRIAPWPAALLGGTILALTPVSALVFRYNQPDAQMILLMTLAASATLRGLEDGSTRFLALAGVAVGLAFLTKQLEALFVLPGLVAGCLVAWPGRPGQRFLAGLAAAGAMLLACGWWVALIELTHWGPDRVLETLPDDSAEAWEDSTNPTARPRSFTLSDRQASLLAPVLAQDSNRYRWVAATPGLINAARLQLACQAPVMGVGGFNKTDPFPEPQAFRRYVSEGAIHYWLDGGAWHEGPRPTCAREIEHWVRRTFEFRYVHGFRLYDLTRPRLRSERQQATSSPGPLKVCGR